MTKKKESKPLEVRGVLGSDDSYLFVTVHSDTGPPNPKSQYETIETGDRWKIVSIGHTSPEAWNQGLYAIALEGARKNQIIDSGMKLIPVSERV